MRNVLYGYVIVMTKIFVAILAAYFIAFFFCVVRIAQKRIARKK